MRTPAGIGASWRREMERQAEKLFHCVHCGFCLPVCPTYLRLGDEADSPRGRLHLMRAVVEGSLGTDSGSFQEHLDLCLGCRACESVCPSGVEYGRLLEGARQAAASARPPSFLARLLARVMATPALAVPLLGAARLLRATGLPDLLARRLPAEGRWGVVRLGLGMLAATAPPDLSPGETLYGSSRPPSCEGSGTGPGPGEGGIGQGRRVALFRGCVQNGLLGHVNRATRRVLEANGFEVVEVPGQGCCGAIHAHMGDLAGARGLARRNLEAFDGAGVDLVVANAAGCGAALKEYGHWLEEEGEATEAQGGGGGRGLGERARRFSERVRDVSEVLAETGLRRGGSLPLSVTYDAPCHLLHAQGIAWEPLRLLGSIPDLDLVPLPGAEECCGGAGLYALTHPDMGRRIGEDKARAVLETGAAVVATGNPGCMMQIGAWLRMTEARVAVAHPVELLDESYRRGGIYGG